MDWSPVEKEELEALIAEQLGGCDDRLVDIYRRIAVPLRRVPFHRLGATEYVFVIAEYESGVIYYEDVEDGFELGVIGPDGAILDGGCEQLSLCHVLVRLGSNNSLKPRTPDGAA